MDASMEVRNGRRSRPVVCNDFDEESYGAFKINGWENPGMTMTFERLRFSGLAPRLGQRHPTDHLRPERRLHGHHRLHLRG